MRMNRARRAQFQPAPDPAHEQPDHARQDKNRHHLPRERMDQRNKSRVHHLRPLLRLPCQTGAARSLSAFSFQSASGGSALTRYLAAPRPCRSPQSLHSAFRPPQADQHFSFPLSALSFRPLPHPVPSARTPLPAPSAALFLLQSLRSFTRHLFHQREREPDQRAGQRHPADLEKQSRTGRIERRDRHVRCHASSVPDRHPFAPPFILDSLSSSSLTATLAALPSMLLAPLAPFILQPSAFISTGGTKCGHAHDWGLADDPCLERVNHSAMVR